jgi:hypothetical protein
LSNILVLKNYTVTDHTKWYNDRSAEPGLSENYDAMEDLCVRSARQNLLELDEVMVHRGTAENIRDVFRTHFEEIYTVWKQGNNVLYSDLDVVFTQPVYYFDEFNYFSMFNLTDPASTRDDHYGLSFDYYFNCGIRYYPKEMSQDTWDLGFAMLENWNNDRWDSEQIIYNAMMWSQNIEPREFYLPQYAYQLLYPLDQNNQNDRFNQISLDDAYAVHVHSSRGSANRLQVMKNLVDKNT